MLYEMLVGEQPYKGEQPMQIAFQHATDSVPRPSVKNPGVPEQLDELVLWATEKSPDDRPVDAREMLDRLREIERELGIAPQVARTAPTGVIRDEARRDRASSPQVLPDGHDRRRRPRSTTSTTPRACAARPSAARARAAGSIAARAAARRARRRRRLVVRLGSGLAGRRCRMSRASPSRRRRQILAEESLSAVQKDVYDLDVAAGHGRSAPIRPAGSRSTRTATVTVLVSQGPQPQTVQALAGMTADRCARHPAGRSM